MQRLCILICFCCLACLSSNAIAQEWKLRKQNNEIRVYSANTVDSGFNMIRVEALLAGTMDKFMTILKDVKNNSQWVYKTKLAYKLDSLNSNDFRYYAVTMLPFPLSNRDMVIRMQFLPDVANNQVVVRATGQPDALPAKRGLVRVKKFNGTWQVKQMPGDHLSITYHLKIDSGGNVPVGVSNLFISTGPFETFKNLGKMLRRWATNITSASPELFLKFNEYNPRRFHLCMTPQHSYAL